MIDGRLHLEQGAGIHNQRRDRVEIRQDEGFFAEIAMQLFEHPEQGCKVILVGGQQHQRSVGVGEHLQVAVEITERFGHVAYNAEG